MLKIPITPTKQIAYILYVPLFWGAILTHHCVLRSTTEKLFMNLYYCLCQLAPLMLQLGHSNRFYYFKHIVDII